MTLPSWELADTTVEWAPCAQHGDRCPEDGYFPEPETVLCAVCNTFHELEFDCVLKPEPVDFSARWGQQNLPFNW